MFLSLKYHRLHPEYIYSRVKQLAGKYNLRLVLVMVDIPNHEDSLRELSKTSIINNLTLILCWSAPEAAHYLELYKSSENAQPTAIRAQQAQSYKESLVEFVTVPRSINKSDAASLISTFGSLQNAINAQPEQISAVPGWGEKKVQQWCHAVREDFRVESTKRASAPAIQRRAQLPGVNVEDIHDQNMEEEDEEEAVLREVLAESRKTAAAQAAQAVQAVQAAPPTEPQVGGQQTEEMSEGIAAAIARLRDNAG
jgi:DNA excision repair protein ERCC-1